MNALVENFPRWLAVISVGALGVAVAHEYGYFWVLGPHFQTIATTYDYLVNALLWLPSTIFIVGVVYTFEGFMVEPENYSWPTFPPSLMIGVCSPLVVIGTMTFFLGGTFVYEIAYLLSIAAVYCGLAAYAFKYGPPARIELDDIMKPSESSANKEIRGDCFASELLIMARKSREMKRPAVWSLWSGHNRQQHLSHHCDRLQRATPASILVNKSILCIDQRGR